MTSVPTPDLPLVVRLLWGLDVAGSRGPKRGLTVYQVVDAAIELADREGTLTAVSMKAVAERLGLTTMALYRYVDSKDTLVELMFDRAIGAPPPIDPAAGWRAGLEQFAWAEFRGMRSRPWWLEIPLDRPPTGPNNMAWLEAGLSALADTATPEPVKLRLVLNLSLYVIGRLRLTTQLAASQDDADYPLILAQVLSPDRFPTLLTALAAQAFDDDETDWADADFAFALNRLLDGYAALLDHD
jgi:AcrR family transcriptional regulator